MIVIGENVEITTNEDIESFINHLKKFSYKKEHEIFIRLFNEFLTECFILDKKLQDMVNEKLSNEFLSLVFVPVEETDNLRELSFNIISLTERKIKKRDEIVYRNLCDICFGNFDTFYYRLLDYYNE